MIELFDFQRKASDQIADRCIDYLSAPVQINAQGRLHVVPFFQALDAITASGKTVILADATNTLRSALPTAPVVLWLSKGKVVVDQTYANLVAGGKYHHLIPDFEVKALAEYDAVDVASNTEPLIFIATVGTFNQRDKEHGTLLIHKSDIEDTANESIWVSLKKRADSLGRRRALIVVYDEAHNLTDQQTDLLLELEPDAFFAASATMKLPEHLGREVRLLREQGNFTDEQLVTHVDAKAVAGSGLVKDTLLLRGYKSPMEETVATLLTDLNKAQRDVKACGFDGRPKAIYVCRTNIVEGDAHQKDDPKRPFEQRQAPPILIWRYLVDQGIEPDDIAVYCSLTFDKGFPPPAEFQHFKGGDSDYDRFVAGNFHHIIFNLSLQEGWDDPLCYFAYVDKSMDSRVQIEQIIGRVLRQPNARHYSSQRLNTAHFYVRVDNNKVFDSILQGVARRLSADAPGMLLMASPPGKSPPEEFEPKEAKVVPGTALDPTDALGPVSGVLAKFADFRNDNGANTKSEGSRSMARYVIGDDQDVQVEWERFNYSHTVTLRWLFTREVRRQYPRALEVVDLSDPKLDARVGIGSTAHQQAIDLAKNIIDAYLDNVFLVQKRFDPYVVGPILVRGDDVDLFNNSLHPGYSGLRSFELRFAQALDKTGLPWVRNPPRGSGYGIPLITRGSSKTFYPDFLVWKGSNVFAIDPKGDHLLLEAATRKLLHVRAPENGTTSLHVQLVSEGTWSTDVGRQSVDGFTLWSIKDDGSRRASTFADLDELVKRCTSPSS